MEGKKTVDSMAKFNPLMILRYSATHKTEHNKIHKKWRILLLACQPQSWVAAKL